MPRSPNQPCVFIGGAPRSGTTVTHALICTSARTNPYQPEISFLTPLFRTYQVGTDNWASHTRHFFASHDEFRRISLQAIDVLLAQISKVGNDPEFLSVKDPLLTPQFPYVAAVMRERARFVTVVRHPHAVVRSRQEVFAKQNAGAEFGGKQLAHVCREYNQSYRHVISGSLDKEKLLVIKYEDLNEDDTVQKLRDFLEAPDIDPATIWADRRQAKVSGDDRNPWYSPKYNRGIDLESRLDELKPEFKKAVDELCAPAMRHFGY